MAKPKMSDAALEFLSPKNPPEIVVGSPAPEAPPVVAKEPTKETVKASASKPKAPTKSAVAVPAPAATRSSVETQLAALQAEMARLQEKAREEAIRKARYPWENPEVVQHQPRLGYNMKLEPELYLKIQWLMENRGGIKSIQVFLDRAAKKLAQEMLEELGAA